MIRFEALKHAIKAHASQVDRCGQPYILHPIAVAEATEAVEWAPEACRQLAAALLDAADAMGEA